MPPRVVLLGPQRLQPTLGTVVAELGPSLPAPHTPTPTAPHPRIATITAGWEERESEDQELSDHLWNRTVNLELHRRVESAFQRDPELATAFRARGDTLRKVQELYRLRLAHTLESARELLRRTPHNTYTTLLESEREAAIEAVRTLDTHHLARVRAIEAEFQARWHPTERDALAAERRELSAILASCSLLCIAGGHVAVLLDRLRLLGIAALAADLPIIGWSAGAMVLSERVILFHDHPPQGAGNAEVLEQGLGLAPGVVPLPHASRRLALADPTRVSLLARRFGPALCAALDPLTRLDWDGRRWSAGAGTRRLCADGELRDLGAAAA